MASTCVNTTVSVRHVRRLPILSWVIDAYQTSRERRTLASLDDSRLEDLGLTYREAHHEATRPFWNVPAHWLR